MVDHVDEAAKRAGGNLKWGIDPPGVLPAWIAEHDLGPPPVVRDALRRLADLPDVGYSRRANELGHVFADWTEVRHGWRPDPHLVVPTADVLQGIWAVVAAFSEPGEGVITTPPVYPYFHDVAPSLRRRSLECPLRHDADGWRLDLDDLATLLEREPAARILLLCSPHNPTGHLYSRDELQAMVELTPAPRRHPRQRRDPLRPGVSARTPLPDAGPAGCGTPHRGLSTRQGRPSRSPA